MAYFMIDADPPQNLVAAFRMTEFNPVWELFHVFGNRGFNLRFEPREFSQALLDQYSQDQLVQRVDLYCDDSIEAVNLKLRATIIEELPDFKFLSFFNYGTSVDRLEVLENIVAGRVMDEYVQSEIPGAHLITLNDEDKKSILARAYARSEASLETITAIPTEPRTAEETALSRAAARQGWDIPEIEVDLIEIKRKKQELGVEPMSVERLKEIVSSIADRVEALLNTPPSQ